MPIDYPVNRLALRCIGAVLLIAGSSTLCADDPAALEARLEQLRSEIAAIQQRLDRDLGERDASLEALAMAERQVSRARRARRETAEVLERTRAEISRLNHQQAELEDKVARHADILARQLVVAYRHGAGSRLRMLLNQDDPRQLSRRLAYHGYLTRARLDAMQRLAGALDELARTRQALDDQRSSREQLLVQQQAELESFEQAQAERGEALAELEARIRDDRERLADLERDAAELAALLEQLATALADVPPELETVAFGELRGHLPVPVEGPLRRRFGDHRGGEMQWNGWLISAPIGEPVRAIAHGRVAYSDWLRGYGLLMIIDHGDGFMSLYAHNESLLRDVGDWVSPGEPITTVGNSGGTGETGVYFELRRDGQPVNPAGWVAR